MTEAMSGILEDSEDDAAQSHPSSSSMGPFAIEFRAARLTLLRSRRSGNKEQEAAASLAMAELQLARGRLAKAFHLAKAASGIFPAGRSRAQAERLIIQALVAEGKAGEALRLAEQHVAFFESSGLTQGRSEREPALRLALADVRMHLGQPRAAVRAVAAALLSLRALHDEAGTAAALQVSARANLSIGSWRYQKRALRQAEEALLLFRRLGNAAEEASTLLLMSSAHLARREYENARAFASDSVKLSRVVGCRSVEAAALQQLAEVILEARAEPDEAMEPAKEAVYICQDIGDWRGEIAARHVVARVCRADGLVNMAFEEMRAVLELARGLRDDRLVGAALGVVSQLYTPEDALAVATEQAQLARNSGDVRVELTSLREAATQHVALGRTKEALNFAEAAVELCRGAGDSSGEARAMQTVADAHLVAECPDEALDAEALAQSLYQEAGDIQGVASTWERMCTMHEAMDNLGKVLSSRTEQCRVYRDAGWKEEEAAVQLSLARLLLRTSGPLEAAAAAREAVALYREVQDEAREAESLLALAGFLVATASPTDDAAQSASAARQLFKALEDMVGEARALEALADVHLATGASEEAVRVAREALLLRQQAGDQQGQACTLQVLARAQTLLAQKGADDESMHPSDAMRHAVEASEESSALLSELGDPAGQASALIQLSRLHLLNQDGDAALREAKQAAELCSSHDDTQAAGAAFLAMARAYLYLGLGKLAQHAAEDARCLCEELGESAGLAEAMQLIEAAEESAASATALSGTGLEAPGDIEVEAGGAGEEEEAPELRCPEGHALGLFTAEDEDFECDGCNCAAARGATLLGCQSCDYDLCLECAAELGGPPAGALGLPPPPERSTPRYLPGHGQGPQRSLLGLWEAASVAAEWPEPPAWPPAEAPAPERGAPSALEQDSLASALHTVCPDWSAREVFSVREKLARICIETAPELFRQLHSVGVIGVNARLKSAGQKSLKTETLLALRDYGDSVQSGAVEPC